MSFKLSITEEELASAGTGSSSFIGTSGIYDVRVLAVTEDINENGAVTLGLYVDAGGEKPQMLYGALPMATYDNQNPIKASQVAFGTMCKIGDIPLTTDFKGTEASLPIGKAGAAKDVSIYEDFEDLELKIWVKQSFYRKKDGSIGDSRTIKGVFRQSDNAAADEIDGTSPVGTKFAKFEKYFTDIEYKDVTEDEVKAMIDARRNGGDAPAAKSAPAKRSKFAK